MYLTCKIKLKTRESAKSSSTHAKLVNSHAKPEKKKLENQQNRTQLM